MRNCRGCDRKKREAPRDKWILEQTCEEAAKYVASMRQKIRQYLPALLLYIQKRVEGGRGAVVSIKTQAVCGVDRRCKRAVRRLMTRLVERGLARQHKRGIYLIERRAANEVLKILEEQCGGLKAAG